MYTLGHIVGFLLGNLPVIAVIAAGTIAVVTTLKIKAERRRRERIKGLWRKLEGKQDNYEGKGDK